jgi:hypothetical protein
MQTIQFLSNSDSASALKAVAPIVHQSTLSILAGTGTTPKDLLAPIVAGECAAFGGQIVNKGCMAIKATITYLDGADCDSCTTETLTTLDVEVVIPANSVFPLPQGYHQGIKVVTAEEAGAPLNNTTDVKLNFYSSYQPSCGGCVAAI